MDRIECHGLQYEVEIGFHDYERGVLQKILVDFEAGYTSHASQEPDAESAIIIDYYQANKLIAGLLEQNKFKLLEKAGEAIANLLLSSYKISHVKVKVTKYPLDMPNAESVSYVCERARRQ